MRVLNILMALTLSVTMLLGGCSITTGTDKYQGLEVPDRGEPISQEIWDAADELAAQKPRPGGPLSLGDGHWWLLPFNIANNQIDVALNEQEARRTSISWYDLSTPLFFTFLPWRVSYARDYYERGAETNEPVGGMRFGWNLLYTRVVEYGRVQDPIKLRSFGMPLLFSRVTGQHRSRDTRFSYSNILWTLGPGLITYKSSPYYENSEELLEGWFFFPLQLGGILGPLVWLDFGLETEDGRVATAHGPLFGYLGYVHSHRPFETGMRPVPGQWDLEEGEEPEMEEYTELERAHSMALLGILWESLVKKDEDGDIVRGRHGPLWGMFGWGHEKGGFAVRAFWIPIRLGKSNPDVVKYYED